MLDFHGKLNTERVSKKEDEWMDDNSVSEKQLGILLKKIRKLGI